MFIVPDVVAQSIESAIDLFLFNPATPVEVRLFTNAIVPNKLTVFGDFVELTALQVPGYSALGFNPVSVPNPWRQAGGAWGNEVQSFAPFFATGPPPIPVSVYGAFLTATIGPSTILMGSFTFDAPYVFSQTGDGFFLDLVVAGRQVGPDVFSWTALPRLF